jgi:endo-1,4-beta-xylanase
MRFTNPTIPRSNFKLIAITLFFFSTSFMACKSSIDEDINARQDEVASQNELAANYVSGAVSLIKGSTLKGKFSFPVGSSVIKERLEESTYSNVLSRDFNSVTVESSLNFKGVHPAKNKWTFEKGDAIVAYAERNNMRVHGQTLIYPKDSMMPKWVLNFKGNKKQWKKLMQTHIQTVVGHYKGKIAGWDVINEAIADNGTLKNNIWLREIGEEYIPLAFKYAHEADPKALLFYNDYGQEYGGKKMAKILDMVEQGKRSGIPIHGLGFQMHTVLRIDVQLIVNNLVKAVNTGLLVSLSELDVSVRYKKPEVFTLDLLLAQQQGDKVEQIVRAYKNTVPAAQQYGVTVWGVGDTDSFWNVKYENKDHDYPLLYDRFYAPKPAYRGFLAAGSGK